MSESLLRIEGALEKHNLLNHPFYQAWDAGELSRDALALYAREYSRFIAKVADGWEACGDSDIAAEEREHHDLWMKFYDSLGTSESNKRVKEVDNLTTSCDAFFGSYAGALGALYAFEAQQPHTSKSKLQGLRTHYKAFNADETYFVVHENDFEEPGMLLGMMDNLPEHEQEHAAFACERTCALLWDALSGIQTAAC